MIQPIGDKILVEHATVEEEILDSGIIIPEFAQPKPMVATVVATGDKLREPFAPGTTVVIGKYVGHTVEYEGKLLTIVRESEVMCRLE